MRAWMFPGQGSQKPGMALGLEEAPGLFAAGKDLIPNHLQRLCTTDPNPAWAPELLQPALFVTEVALAQRMHSEGHRPEAVVGHSLGEFPALVAAGVLEFTEALRLVARRARAMADAGRQNSGAMAAVIGLDPEEIGRICEDEGDVWLSNLNSPKQTVISGRDRGLAAAAKRCKEAGAKRVIRLQVPLAAHCPLMEPAREEFRAALDGVCLAHPSCPVYCDADGAAHTDPEEIKNLLAQAITAPVRYTDAIRRMCSDGYRTFIEVGPGKVLRGLVRQIDPEADLIGVGTDIDIAALGPAQPAGGPTSRRTTIPNQPRTAGALS